MPASDKQYSDIDERRVGFLRGFTELLFLR
jgi:hypothetical protein